MRVMPTNPEPLAIGRIAGVFGVTGELKCDPTSAGRTLFSNGARLSAATAAAPESTHEIVLRGVREHKGRLLVRIAGIDDVDAAQAYVGARLYAPRDRVAAALSGGEYLDADLSGCAILDAAGRRLGTVDRVEHYPASDMLIVDGKMLPFIAAFIDRIDIEKKQIVVRDLPADLI